MLEVILISHGGLAQALLESGEMLLGKQEEVTVMGVWPGEDIDKFREDVAAVITKAGARGEILVLTDIKSGSPYNAVVAVMLQKEFRHIAGVNLPVLLEVLGSRTYLGADEICAAVMREGRDTIVDVNEVLKGL